MEFKHFFIPHISNNFRAKLLHHQILSVFVLGLFLGGFLLSYFSSTFPKVLGQAIDISVEKLVQLTNDKRIENGEKPLKFNEKLSQAAALKAEDMFKNDYWAHNSPTGVTPWVFVKDSGYQYIYAGENLARGFTNSEDVVNAWMASESHKNNLLSGNYEDIGFAVKRGRLKGEETVLIVQMFGSTTLSPGSEFSIATSSQSRPSQVAGEIRVNPLIDSKIISSGLTQTLVILFIFVLILDMVVVKRQNILRFVGHNLDHILFLSLVVLILGVLGRGFIL
jgi:hypothetical protein